VVWEDGGREAPSYPICFYIDLMLCSALQVTPTGDAEGTKMFTTKTPNYSVTGATGHVLARDLTIAHLQTAGGNLRTSFHERVDVRRDKFILLKAEYPASCLSS